MNSVAVKRTYTLPWQSFLQMCGGESELKEMLKTALNGGPAPEGSPRLREALKLAEEIVSGAKPIPAPGDDPLWPEDDSNDE